MCLNFYSFCSDISSASLNQINVVGSISCTNPKHGIGTTDGRCKWGPWLFRNFTYYKFVWTVSKWFFFFNYFLNGPSLLIFLWRLFPVDSWTYHREAKSFAPQMRNIALGAVTVWDRSYGWHNLFLGVIRIFIVFHQHSAIRGNILLRT